MSAELAAEIAVPATGRARGVVARVAPRPRP
jgi:hypothetical protein